MNTIGLFKESNDRALVALSPSVVKTLASSFTVLVEENAGVKAGFSNTSYQDAGAKVVSNRESIINDAQILISYASPLDLSTISAPKTVIGCYHVLDGMDPFEFATNKHVTFYSLDLLPRTTLAQSMDVLSSLASLIGYQAVLEGFSSLDKVAPMISGAGGTLQPSKVMVLGVGVAGLQAIATAKRLGAIVSAFDIRKQTKQEVESLGARFIEIEGATEDKESGGYAVEQAEEFTRKIQLTIAKECKDIDLIITTAKIPGRKAPILIAKDALSNLKNNSVIVDIATRTGGNVEKGEQTQTIIIEAPELFNKVAYSASILLGNNIKSFLNYIEKNKEDLDNDPIASATLVAKNGELIHPRLKK